MSSGEGVFMRRILGTLRPMPTAVEGLSSFVGCRGIDLPEGFEPTAPHATIEDLALALFGEGYSWGQRYNLYRSLRRLEVRGRVRMFRIRVGGVFRPHPLRRRAETDLVQYQRLIVPASESFSGAPEPSVPQTDFLPAVPAPKRLTAREQRRAVAWFRRHRHRR